MPAPRGATLIEDQPAPAGATLVGEALEVPVGHYDGLTPDEAGSRRTEVIDMAAEIGIGADAVERNIDRARQRMAAKSEPLTPPKGVQPGSGRFQWDFRAVDRKSIARRNERDDAVLSGLREYLGPESERGPVDIERAETFFRRGRTPLPHERAEVSADMRAKFAALSDDDLKLVSNALLVQVMEVSDSVHEALARERKVRPVIEYIKSLPEEVQVAIEGMRTTTNRFGAIDFLSKEIGLERLWGQTEGDVAIVFEAARRVQTEKNQEEALNLARAVGIGGEIVGTIVEFAAVPDITSKIAAFGKLGNTAQRVISTSSRFALRAALQLPGEGETLGGRAADIGVSAATGAGLGTVGGKIASPFLRAGRVVGTTGGFMGLTAVRGGDIEDIIETGALVLGFQAFGAIRRGAVGLRVRMERVKLARAIKAVRRHNPDLRGVPDETIGVVLDGYQQISWWRNQYKAGKVTEDVAVARVNEILDKLAPAARVIRRSVRTASASEAGGEKGPQTAEAALQADKIIAPGAKPPAPRAEGAKPAGPAADIAARQDAQARAVEEIDAMATQHLRSISGRERGDLAVRGVLPELTPQERVGGREEIVEAQPPEGEQANLAAIKTRLDAAYKAGDLDEFSAIIEKELKPLPPSFAKNSTQGIAETLLMEARERASPEGLPELADQGPIGLREEAPGAVGRFDVMETSTEELDAIVDEVRKNEGAKAARIVAELHDAGIETDSTHVTPDEIIVAVREHNLSPENRAVLEAAGNITVEDTNIGVLIRVAQPADPVLQTGLPAERARVREITAANLEALDANVEKCPRCTNETLEAFGIRKPDPVITGLAVKEAFAEKGLELAPVAAVEPGTRLDEFVESHPDGSFYVMTSQHAMALIDGELTDFAQGTGRRKVVGAFEILAGAQRAGPKEPEPETALTLQDQQVQNQLKIHTGPQQAVFVDDKGNKLVVGEVGDGKGLDRVILTPEGDIEPIGAGPVDAKRWTEIAKEGKVVVEQYIKAVKDKGLTTEEIQREIEADEITIGQHKAQGLITEWSRDVVARLEARNNVRRQALEQLTQPPTPKAAERLPAPKAEGAKAAILAAEVADLEAYEKEIKAKDGTTDEFPVDFKVKITKSLTAKKKLLSKAEAGEEDRRQELVKQLESIVVQKGIGVGRAKEIFMEFGGQSAPELKTRKMSVEQLEAVIDVVRQERPKRIGHKQVITEKTEEKIQTLFQRMMKNEEMTADHYDKILTDIIGGERVGEQVRTREPRFISGARFVTETQGKDIIQTMLDSAEVIRETESLAAAVRGRPDIEPIVRRLEERIAAKTKRDPHSLMSMRRFNQQFEITAETPVYTMYEKLIQTNQLLARERELVRQSFRDAVDDFDKIARDEEALQRVSDYIAAKSYLEDKPESPPDITADEVKLANRIEEVLESYEIKARVGKFFTWLGANKPLSGLGAMPQYDRFEPEIVKALDIYEGQGFEELWRYLTTQQWGVIKSGYEPLQVLSTKLRLHKMPETAVAKTHVRPREDMVYHKQEKNILQRLDSYMKQMDTLADLHPIIKGYARLINEKLDDFKKPQNISTDIEHFLNNLKRFNIQGGLFERLSSRLYAQAVKAVILDNPVLAFRNRFQPWSFEADKSILFDPRNKKLSPEDIEFVETHVLQARNMMIEYFLVGEKPLPGLKTLSAFVDKTTFYPGSDTANRWQTFTGKINQVWRALEQSESVEEMMVRAKFSDMTELEQRHALGILARDGEDAMARFVAKQHTDEVHFRYERAERAPAEMSPVGKVVGNLITFSRSYWEHTIIAAGKIFDSSVGLAAQARALKVFLALTVGAWFTGRVYMGVTGRRRNPYSPFRLLGFRPGGLAIGVLETAGDVYNNMLDAVSGDERALNALPTSIVRAADMFIPYYDMVVSGIEAQVDLKNIDRVALQEIRGLIDSEYERRGGADRVYRTAIEKWQRTLAGAGVDITLEELGRQKKIVTAIEPGDFEGRGLLGGPGKAEKAFIKKADKFYPELAELRKDANLGKLDSAGFFRKLQLEAVASSLNAIADGLEKAESPAARRKLFDLADKLIGSAAPDSN